MENLENKMSLVKETKYILEKLGHNPRKRFGQNFLISENTIKNILQKSEITKEDLVIEIGPGIGSLTKYLLESAKEVICIEIDNDLARFLEDRFRLYDNFKLINEDVLKVDLRNKVLKSGYKRKNIKIVANLPYYITTPIILSLLDLDISDITVMVQKEVAERFTEKSLSKKRSNITYIIEFEADAKILFNVSKNNFMPSPKVDSSIISLKLKTKEEKKKLILDAVNELKEKIEDEDKNEFENECENIDFDLEKINTDLSFEEVLKIKEVALDIIKHGFMHKRKKLISALKLAHKYDISKIEKGMDILNISKDIRAEKINLNEYIKLSYIYLFL